MEEKKKLENKIKKQDYNELKYIEKVEEQKENIKCKDNETTRLKKELE